MLAEVISQSIQLIKAYQAPSQCPGCLAGHRIERLHNRRKTSQTESTLGSVSSAIPSQRVLPEVSDLPWALCSINCFLVGCVLVRSMFDDADQGPLTNTNQFRESGSSPSRNFVRERFSHAEQLILRSPSRPPVQFPASDSVSSPRSEAANGTCCPSVCPLLAVALRASQRSGLKVAQLRPRGGSSIGSQRQRTGGSQPSLRAGSMGKADKAMTSPLPRRPPPPCHPGR